MNVTAPARTSWDTTALLFALLLLGAAFWFVLDPDAGFVTKYSTETSSGGGLGGAIVCVMVAAGFVWLARPTPLPPSVERIGQDIPRDRSSPADDA